MSDRTAEVLIIGAGIIGASVAYHLAIRGCTDVLILEKAESPITGSTALSAGGVRHQFAREVNIRLSKYSIERLKNFSEEVGGQADLRQRGYLFLINKEETWAQFQEQVSLQQSLGVQVELLEARDTLKYVPGIRLDDIVGGTFGAEDGFCDPYGIASGYLKRARELGVRVALSSPVTATQLKGERVMAVDTPNGPVSGEYVVNACGAWSGQVASLFGIDLPVQPYRRNAYMTERFLKFPDPIPLTFDVDTGFWMRKEQDSLLFGMANPADPPGVNLNVDWNWLPEVLDAGIDRFPLLEEARLAKKQCWAGLYEITPDHMPILGRHPEIPNYLHASGFSGQGVMHSPATGMMIAEEILDGRAHSIDIDDLRITRFEDMAIENETNIY
ncbi:MAG: FAD-binding oxidoreductase [Acidobacteriota bacterium]